MRHQFGKSAGKCGVVVLTLLLSVIYASHVSASPPIAIGPMNPVGSGARATGMGGAFIGVADDATAASWNPAGLINLEKPEVSFVYNYDHRSNNSTASQASGLLDSERTIDVSDVNYLSAAYPFKLLDRNMVVSINYQRMYDMNKKATDTKIWPTVSKETLSTTSSFVQEGGLSPLSPAIAIQVLPELYFGATVNIWDNFAGTNSWTSTINETSGGSLAPLYPASLLTQSYEFSGLNANLGLLYTFKNTYNFGFVFKTPFDADVAMTQNYNNQVLSRPFTLSMPASYGFGFSYRHSDRLTMAIDVYRTLWSDYKVMEGGVEYNPLTSELMTYGGQGEDTTQVRIGGEYLMIGDKITVPIRGGLFYDPQPGVRLAGKTAGHNVYSSKIDDYYGFSIGSGIALGNIAFDLSYQYRWGNGVTGENTRYGQTADVSQHTLSSSLILHF